MLTADFASDVPTVAQKAFEFLRPLVEKTAHP